MIVSSVIPEVTVLDVWCRTHVPVVLVAVRVRPWDESGAAEGGGGGSFVSVCPLIQWSPMSSLIDRWSSAPRTCPWVFLQSSVSTSPWFFGAWVFKLFGLKAWASVQAFSVLSLSVPVKHYQSSYLHPSHECRMTRWEKNMARYFETYYI